MIPSHTTDKAVVTDNRSHVIETLIHELQLRVARWGWAIAGGATIAIFSAGVAYANLLGSVQQINRNGSAYLRAWQDRDQAHEETQDAAIAAARLEASEIKGDLKAIRATVEAIAARTGATR